MAFSWFFKSKKDAAQAVEESMKDSEKIKAEIDNMQGSIVKTSKTYQENIKKYKDIAKFNQHLTRSYISNMKVIVDVSELLNSYANVFGSLKDEFAKMESALGKPLEISDFEYLEGLTKTKIETLSNEFQKQSDGIKKLYAEYGKPDELNRIILAQGSVQKVIENASNTYTSLQASSQGQDKKPDASSFTIPAIPTAEVVLQPSLQGGKKKGAKGAKGTKGTKSPTKTKSTSPSAKKPASKK